jgi:REP element-mobilizing transposase RayT
MPRARNTLVSLDATPYYHCVSRCVRRAFLCGEDSHSGRSFEHRRQWIEDRLLEVAGVFAIDIATYAIMSNHYHVVLYIDSEQADTWTDVEVAGRWMQLFHGDLLSQQYLRGEMLTKAELKAVGKQIAKWRERLTSISWFMRCVNEPVAREANREDDVSGHFWEGRFRLQALLDEQALAACMAYVDLNPIRARMAMTPETSDHTSVKRRIEQALATQLPNRVDQQPANLMPFAGNPREPMPKGLPFRLTDYLELVDWSGRIIREDKRGAIPENIPEILNRLNMDASNWLYLTQNFESPFKHLVGAAHNIRSACESMGKCWVHGVSHCERLFSSG